MIEPKDCKLGRRYFGISQDELAFEAKVGLKTLQNFEQGKKVRPRTHRRIHEALLSIEQRHKASLKKSIFQVVEE